LKCSAISAKQVRKYNFANRIILIWNNYVNNIVIVNTVNTFKNRLDKFWQHQAIQYNYWFNITNTGSCSFLDA